MLHVSIVKGPPTEVQTFSDDDLAKRLTDHDVETIREIFRTPLTGSYNWDYENANTKIRRLYELGKRFNWNSELDIDWTQPYPINPSLKFLLDKVLTDPGEAADRERRCQGHRRLRPPRNHPPLQPAP